MIPSRSDSKGFAQRTMRNLAYIKKVRKNEGRGHIVVQLINSLLGLIAIGPNKHLFAPIESMDLDDLRARGWPIPVMGLPKAVETQTLGDLLRHLRNGVAHARVEYFDVDTYSGGDSTLPHEVALVIEDAPHENAPANWRTQIYADQLESLCCRLLQEVAPEIVTEYQSIAEEH